jgi:hypothetical protein
MSDIVIRWPRLFNWRGMLTPVCVELSISNGLGWRCLRVFGLRVAVWAVLR